ncbi:DNA repair protein RadC [Pseudolysobacter antarcticus]|uniref:DNA repair protein RadC n=1 Tax=Pseudolysobacter antarcticus TaxID=2511995 RepID=A0A411HG05_9GAMM|nr:DNA repair protein RadC [Pseudolysobacter antarcticus]QBB69433.1 DNA repair protein RadC [Pseudolysobacter antarcticus]
MSLIRDTQGTYRKATKTSITEADILQAAETILRLRFERLDTLGSPSQSAAFLTARLAHLEHEEFHIVWLDQRNRVIAVEALFQGTIDGCSVHCREVIRSALKHNAAAAILAHNHPSGVADPSQADKHITTELKNALALVGVRVLDHIVVGGNRTVSLAERGWV